MSMEIFVDRIEVHVPNSEALIEAQHYGIKDRTVGQYYMSEKSNEVIGFLNNLQGVFYLDFHISRSNIIALIEKLKENEKVKNLLKIRTIVFDSGCPECIDAIGRETILAMIEQC